MTMGTMLFIEHFPLLRVAKGLLAKTPHRACHKKYEKLAANSVKSLIYHGGLLIDSEGHANFGHSGRE
jgi:hypothetical protein